MKPPHIIRLRGPWQQFAEGQKTGPPTKTIQMPASWSDDLGPDFCGQVTYARWFHRPSSLTKDTRLTLTFQQIVGDALVSLNGVRLGEACWPHHPHRFDLTGLLQSRNELRVKVRGLTHEEMLARTQGESIQRLGGGLVGEVHLEIG